MSPDMILVSLGFVLGLATSMVAFAIVSRIRTKNMRFPINDDPEPGLRYPRHLTSPLEFGKITNPDDEITKVEHETKASKTNPG